jgi:putative transposase
MSRPLRIHLPDLIYHVLNRGNNRQPIFIEDEDYLHYLDILKRYKEKFNFKLFAYCLMTNHVHLLIKTSSVATVSQIMKAITISHTRHYHLKQNTSGHIWQGRFKSPLVSDDEYLLAVMRYIEQNPLRAGIVKHPEEYPFSSYQANTRIAKDGLVDKEDNPVFTGLGNSTEERTLRYKEFVLAGLEEDKLNLIRKSLSGQTHFGSERFLSQIKSRLTMTQKRPRGHPKTKIINSQLLY